MAGAEVAQNLVADSWQLVANFKPKGPWHTWLRVGSQSGNLAALLSQFYPTPLAPVGVWVCRISVRFTQAVQLSKSVLDKEMKKIHDFTFSLVSLYFSPLPSQSFVFSIRSGCIRKHVVKKCLILTVVCISTVLSLSGFFLLFFLITQTTATCCLTTQTQEIWGE